MVLPIWLRFLFGFLFYSKDSIGDVVLIQVTRALLFGDGKARVLSVPPPSGGYLIADVANAVAQVSYSVTTGSIFGLCLSIVLDYHCCRGMETWISQELIKYGRCW